MTYYSTTTISILLEEKEICESSVWPMSYRKYRSSINTISRRERRESWSLTQSLEENRAEEIENYSLWNMSIINESLKKREWRGEEGSIYENLSPFREAAWLKAEERLEEVYNKAPMKKMVKRNDNLRKPGLWLQWREKHLKKIQRKKKLYNEEERKLLKKKKTQRRNMKMASRGLQPSLLPLSTCNGVMASIRSPIRKPRWKWYKYWPRNMALSRLKKMTQPEAMATAILARESWQYNGSNTTTATKKWKYLEGRSGERESQR